jgi:hypothetical protein
MAEQDVSNCSVFISWLCKYGDKEAMKQATAMFEEANAKKWVLDEDAYIGLVNQMNEIDSIDKFFQTLAQMGVKPSIRLFNAAIQSLNKVF